MAKRVENKSTAGPDYGSLRSHNENSQVIIKCYPKYYVLNQLNGFNWTVPVQYLFVLVGPVLSVPFDFKVNVDVVFGHRCYCDVVLGSITWFLVFNQWEIVKIFCSILIGNAERYSKSCKLEIFTRTYLKALFFALHETHVSIKQLHRIFEIFAGWQYHNMLTTYTLN